MHVQTADIFKSNCKYVAVGAILKRLICFEAYGPTVSHDSSKIFQDTILHDTVTFQIVYDTLVSCCFIMTERKVLEVYLIMRKFPLDVFLAPL